MIRKNNFLGDISTELSAFFNYLKAPVEHFHEQLNFENKQKIFTILFLAELFFTLSIVIPVLYLVDYILPLKYTELTDDYNVYLIIILGVIAAPLIEEFIFRFPLKWKRNYIFQMLNSLSSENSLQKFWNKHYHYFFYFFAIAFGFVHLLNFDNELTFTFLLLSPFIVLSQLVAGFTFGYIRNRLGFFSAIAYHGLFNFILLIVPYLVYHNTELFKIEEKDLKIEATYLEYKEIGKSYCTIDEKNDTIYNLEAKNMEFKHLMEVVFKKNLKSDDVGFINLTAKSKKGISKKDLLKKMSGKIDIEEN